MRVKPSTLRKPEDRALTELESNVRELEARTAKIESDCRVHAGIIDSLGHAVFCSWEWPTEEISSALAPSDRSRKH